MAQDEPRPKSVSVGVSFHPHAIHDAMCLSVRWSFLVSLSLLCLFFFSTSSLPHSTCSLPGTPSSMSSPPGVETTALTQNEEYCLMAMYNPLTVPVPVLVPVPVPLPSVRCLTLHVTSRYFALLNVTLRLLLLLLLLFFFLIFSQFFFTFLLHSFFEFTLYFFFLQSFLFF